MWVAGPVGGGGAGRLGRRRREDRAARGRPVPRADLGVRRRRLEPAVRARQPQQAQRRPEPGARRRSSHRRRSSSTAPTCSSPTPGRRRSSAPGSTTRPSSARNPRLVYAMVTGYGLEGDDRDRAAYDVGAFWSRAGVAASLTPDGVDLPYQRGGMGDHMAGMAAAGAVAAALLARERTRRGSAGVDVAAAHRHVHDRLGHQHGAAPRHPRRSR